MVSAVTRSCATAPPGGSARWMGAGRTRAAMRSQRAARGAARRPVRSAAALLVLLAAAVPAGALDTPLEGIPLPRYGQGVRLAGVRCAEALSRPRSRPASRAPAGRRRVRRGRARVLGLLPWCSAPPPGA